MKKILFLFIAAVTFGCTNDDNSSVNPETGTGTKLSKISYQSESMAGYSSYFYDKDKLSDIIETNINHELSYRHEMVYDGDNLVKIKHYRDGKYLNDQDTDYTYSNGRITEAFTRTTDFSYKTEYKYNSKGELLSQSRIIGNGSPETTTYTYDNNGNIKTVSSNSFDTVYEYSYDNKVNPEYYAYPKAIAVINGLSKNNTLSRKSSYEFNNFTYSYTYNEAGLPIERKTLSGFSETAVYEYK
jgi:hypothetical protein